MGGGVPKQYQYARSKTSNAINYKKATISNYRACGTINISKYVNNFLSTNPTTLILSSLVSEF